MIITKRIVRGIARKYLEFIDANEIISIQGLEKLVDLSRSKKNSSDYIEIGKHPSNCGTKALSVSYIIYPTNESLFELKLNVDLNYFQIFLKSGQMIKGYCILGADDENNMFQTRYFLGLKWNNVTDELKNLSELSV